MPLTRPQTTILPEKNTLMMKSRRPRPFLNQPTLRLRGGGEIITRAHGLLTRPREYWATLRCITTEHGYAVGEESNASWNNSTITAAGIVVSATTTNVIANVGAAGAFVISKTSKDTVIITPANWALVLRARL